MTGIWQGDRIQVVISPISEKYYTYGESMLQDKSRGTISGFSGSFKNRKGGRSALFLDREKGYFVANGAYSLTGLDNVIYIMSYYQFLI